MKQRRHYSWCSVVNSSDFRPSLLWAYSLKHLIDGNNMSNTGVVTMIQEPSSTFDSDVTHNLPEHRLLWAMLEMVVRDLHSTDRTAQRSARVWVRSGKGMLENQDSCFSFRDVIEHLDLPSYIVEAIESRAQESVCVLSV